MTPRKSDERFAQVEMRASNRGAQLAKTTKVTRHVAERLLHGEGTLLSKLGRGVLVPVSKIRENIPFLREGIPTSYMSHRAGERGERLG